MKQQTKSYWAGSAQEFLNTNSQTILEKLTLRVSLQHSGDEKKQIQAWAEQIEILKKTLLSLPSIDEWGVLFEMPLTRLAKRIDTILTTPQGIVCLEFKVGAKNYLTADIQQTEDYALSLKAFHKASHSTTIFPILCSTNAPARENSIDLVEYVNSCMLCNSESLTTALKKIVQLSTDFNQTWLEFDQASYSPTPSIIEAARAIWTGHDVAEIGRTDTSKENLEKAKETLRDIVSEARKNKAKVVCFLSGEPGAGKTLVGLDLVFSGNSGNVKGAPAALLSGNRPLVAVLREAITQDTAKKRGLKIKDARRETSQALQYLLDYLKEHLADLNAPPENVIVFDEAQRAWDAKTGKKLLDREASEPEIFLDIMSRLPWAVLVCSVGPGQEINRGEAGFSIWDEAISKYQDLGNEWAIHCSPNVTAQFKAPNHNITEHKELYLHSQLRAYRSESHGNWVAKLLDGDIISAQSIANTMDQPPALISRELNNVKTWLKERRQGSRRVGILASSNAVRLRTSGLPPSPTSKELGDVAHWFLKSSEDFRSSNALELPLSEYVCQGLEIDFAGVCWGYDFIWKNEQWVQQKMSSPKWQIVKNEENQRFRTNAYRVLLTRARAGLIIFIPHGNSEDPTRSIDDMDNTYQALLTAGCKSID